LSIPLNKTVLPLKDAVQIDHSWFSWQFSKKITI